MREVTFADREFQFHTKCAGEKRLNDGTLLRIRKPRSDLCLEVITSEKKTDVGDY